MKKLLFSIVSIMLACCMTFGCLATGFVDVDATTTEGEAITKLANAGILNGYLDGLFHAERSLTRAQFCKIANRVFGYTEAGNEAFKDVPATYWGAQEISIAQKAGYIKGVGNGNFAPERVLTREQVCIMLVRILGYEPLEFSGTISDAVSDWAVQDVKTALAYFIFSLEAGGKFRAQQAITRGEVSVVLARYLKSDAPIVKPDSEYVLALKELSKALATIKATTAEAKVLTPLKTCVDKAIADADNGIEVTKAYIESKYASELKAIRVAFNAMNKNDLSKMKLKIAGETSSKTGSVLYDSFLVADSAGNTSESAGAGGGGGGSGGGGGDEPDPIVPDESEVVQAIRTIATQLQAMLDEPFKIYPYELPVVEPLLDCLYDVLDDAANGTKITKAYVKSTYGSTQDSPIQTVTREYNKLDKTQKGTLMPKLASLDSEATTYLSNYFDIDIS